LNYRRINQVKKALIVFAFLSPWIIGFVMFFVYSIGQAFWFSLTNYNFMNEPRWIGFSNYLSLFSDKVFRISLWNTLYFIVILVPGTLFLALFFAIFVNTKTKVARLGGIFYFLSYIVPFAAIGLVWRWMFNSQYGVINYLLSQVGVEGPPWLASSFWIKPAIIIVQLTLIGQFMIIFLAALQGIPKELYEAAELDGATSWQKSISITVPMISPAILFNLVTLFIIISQIFDIPYIMTLVSGGTQTHAGGPGWSSTTYTMYMYYKLFSEYDASGACAMAFISLILILSVSIVMLKLSKRFVHYTT